MASLLSHDEPMYVRLPSECPPGISPELWSDSIGDYSIGEQLKLSSIPMPVNIMSSTDYKPMYSADTQVDTLLCASFEPSFAPPGLEAPELDPLLESQDPFFWPLGMMDAEQCVMAEDPWMSNESYPKNEVLPWGNFTQDFISNSIGQQAALKAALKAASNSKRWWTSSKYPSACPLTGFPINLLPHPPFKLCMQAGKGFPHTLVDGKYLALQIISSGSLFVNGRSLEQDEVTALSQYMHRCKLGPFRHFRPDHALQLAKDAKSPALEQHERCRAAQELSKLRAAAEAELIKLRRIQMQRLMHLQQRVATGPPEPIKIKKKSRKERLAARAYQDQEKGSLKVQKERASTCSTCSGGSSDNEMTSENSLNSLKEAAAAAA
jgi:hypothetical protein